MQSITRASPSVPGIVRLAAAGRIERRAIQGQRDCAIVSLAHVGDARVEFQQVRIAIVKSFSCAHLKSMLSNALEITNNSP
jgi:hypothetical protein